MKYQAPTGVAGPRVMTCCSDVEYRLRRGGGGFRFGIAEARRTELGPLRVACWVGDLRVPAEDSLVVFRAFVSESGRTTTEDHVLLFTNDDGTPATSLGEV